MVSNHEQIRRIAAVHSLIGIAVELGGRIADGYGHLSPEVIDALLEEFRAQVKAKEIQLWSWEEIGREFFALCPDPDEGLTS